MKISNIESDKDTIATYFPTTLIFTFPQNLSEDDRLYLEWS